ncbi:MAG: TetR/AcrR family transcriptional regulator [Candidatus Dormibacteria bacterium]
MLKPIAQRSADPRSRLMDAALETLKTEGYAGATARAIARTGGLNQALVFYHFGSVRDLLLAALDRTSAERLERYRTELADVRTLSELVDRMRELYQDDAGSHHITAVQQLVSGSSTNPDLGPEIVARLAPWAAFATEIVDRFLKGTAFEAFLAPEAVAFAAIALYLGMETLTHLDPGGAKVLGLFEASRRLAPMVDVLLAGLPAELSRP